MLESFRTAPPARQLMLIAGLGAFLCVLLALAYFLWFRTSYEVLYRDLRPADAATIVAELERTGVDYRLGGGGGTILVPEDKVDTVRVHVAGQDLPLQGTVGFELFNNSSIGLTEFAQRINLQRALQGELARTIMSIDGVESARVHLSLGEQTAFRGDRREARASVSVRTRPGRRLSPTTVRGIQRLVAGSVPELDYANVAVLNDRGAVVSGEPPADSLGAAGSPEEQRVEHVFEARIRRAIEARFPADAIEVNVWAALGENPARGEGAQGEGAHGDGALGDGVIADSRDFRLRATVAIAAPLSGAAQEQVTRMVHQAIGFDAGLGDIVTVTASAPLAAADDWGDAADPAGAAMNGLRAPPPAPERLSFSSLWTPLALLLLIGGIVLVIRRRAASPTPMSEQDRLQYVANLRTLLARREADVAPRA